MATMAATDDVFDSPAASGAVDDDGVRRDQHGRYLLPYPGRETSGERSWTRATTFAKSISDTYTLDKWSQRMVAKGLTMDQGLYARVASLPLESRAELDKVCEEAKSRAGAKTAASLGTALHAFAEQVDRGEEPLIPPPWDKDIAAYRHAMETEGFRVLPDLIERIIVCSFFSIAGTFDRIVQATRDHVVQFPGQEPIHVAAGDFLIGDLKGLALTTPIPTPKGWTTMSAVQVGDEVFDAYGKPCNVVVKSDVKQIGTYIVKFDDGSEIVCDREHIWWTATGFRAGRPQARGIDEVIRTLKNSNGCQHRVPVAGALDLPEMDLPIDPYLLGCWIGDGRARGGDITKGRDLFKILEMDGHQLGVEQIDSRSGIITRTVLGLGRSLRETGLKHNKHIPDRYLRASFSQRLRLLQGLMDTDGTWNTARRTAVFSTTDKALAFQVSELMSTLGQRPHVAEFLAHGFGKEVTAYHVAITPVNIVPFRIPRKRDQALASQKLVTRSMRRVIVSVEEGLDVGTACIAVDSETRTYLCGEKMIPTHNTGRTLEYGMNEIAIQLALYAHGEGVWNKDAHKFEDMPEVRQDVAVVMHLPVESRTCTLYDVDVRQGWRAAELCARVREWRKTRQLAVPWAITTDTPSVPVPASVATRPENGQADDKTAVGTRELTWAEQIKLATSKGELSAIRKAAIAKGEWSKDLLDQGVTRMRQLETA